MFVNNTLKLQLVECCIQNKVSKQCAEEYCKPTKTNSRSINEVMQKILNCKIKKFKICGTYFDDIRRCLEPG